MTAEPNCACGKPLHYTDPYTKELVEGIIARKGEHIPITCAGTTYRVQRHYVALHGIKAQELASLADQGIVERLENAP